MPTLGRRAFLGSVLSSGALLTSGTVHAADGPIRSRVARARRRWAEGERDAEDVLFVERLEVEHPDARAEVRSLARGLGAFAVVRELGELEPEDQAHPEVQHALRDALQAIGDMGATGVDIVERYPFGDAAETEGEEELKVAVRAMRLGVKDWKATVGHQRMVDASLHDLVRDPEPGRLRFRVRRGLRRARRTLELGTAVAEDPSRTGLMAPGDARLREAAERGAERWAHVRSGSASATVSAAETPVPPDGRSRHEALTGRQWAAVIGLGLVSVGGLILFGWAGCAVLCGEMTFLPLALLGLAICGLAVWGLVSVVSGPWCLDVVHAEVARLKRETAAELCPHAPESVKVRLVLESLLGRSVPPLGGGPVVVLDAAPEPRRVSVWASGWVRLRGKGVLNANGRATTAGPGAPLPEAPEGALVVQLGNTWHFIGVVDTVVVAADTELAVDLNLSPAARKQLIGRFGVYVGLFRLSGPGLETADLPADLVYAR